MAHAQGMKLPVRSYFEFVELVTSSPDKVKSLEDYLEILHRWTERIQSGPASIERAVYEVLAQGVPRLARVARWSCASTR